MLNHILTTDVARIREQLCHGETGWIVDNNEQAVFEGLKYLLENPEKLILLKSNDGMDRICSNEEKYKQMLQLIGR